MLCPNCGNERKPGDWPFCPHGEIHGSLRAGNAQRFTPVVVFKDRFGRLSYPGNTNDPPPPGYERVEIASTTGVRQLQKQMDLNARIEHEVHAAESEQLTENWRKRRREKLKEKMQTMSAFGRDLARHAMEMTDAKPRQRFNPGSHIDAFENNRGTRAAFETDGGKAVRE